ncbi:CoA transferase [Candidatus Raskinella chloraquaticus]|uniref:CoA transferase n=1 Tax=Candidatus Raskinella chloraquaticus TaxID=1951219 RepID=UPI00366B6ED7
MLTRNWLVIAANSDPLFRRLATAMGQPALGDDPRFSHHEARGEHQAVLDALIGGWTATLTRQELIERLIAADVPVRADLRCRRRRRRPAFPRKAGDR